MANVGMILERLEQIKVGEDREEHCGICSNLTWLDGEYIPGKGTWMHEHMPQWPKYSGDAEYPVSDPQSCLTPREQYTPDNDKYDPETEYGRLRLELLDFLIEQAKGELHGPE